MKKIMTANYKIRKLCGGLAILVLMVGLHAGCSSTPIQGEKTRTFEDLTLSYMDKSRVGSHINEMTLQHPLALSEQEVLHHLVSLRYEGNSLLSKRKPVFKKDDLQKIRHLFKRALHSVSPHHVVSFELDSKGGTTSGIVFASNGYLHWRFQEIRGVPYPLSSNQVTRYGTAWRLIPQQGQRLYSTKTLLGRKKWTNWIVAKLKLPGKPPTLKKSGAEIRPQETPQNSSHGTPEALEEKLSFLKRLHEKNLIDDQEYRQKRKDLLDQYLK